MADTSRVATVAVNAAFLQEIKETNAEFWDLLQTVLGIFQDPARLIARFHNAVHQLGELRDLVGLHFALEEAYGYFDDPLEVAPQLSSRASALRADHVKLYQSIANLAERCEKLLLDGPQEEKTADLSRRFLDFHRHLQDHEMQENDLIMRAYEDDIGVGD